MASKLARYFAAVTRTPSRGGCRGVSCQRVQRYRLEWVSRKSSTRSGVASARSRAICASMSPVSSGSLSP
jgi:hypothetical protein